MLKNNFIWKWSIFGKLPNVSLFRIFVIPILKHHCSPNLVQNHPEIFDNFVWLIHYKQENISEWYYLMKWSAYLLNIEYLELEWDIDMWLLWLIFKFFETPILPKFPILSIELRDRNADVMLSYFWKKNNVDSILWSQRISNWNLNVVICSSLVNLVRNHRDF